LCKNHGLQCLQQEQTLLVRPNSDENRVVQPPHRHLQTIKLDYTSAEKVRQALKQVPSLLSEQGFIVVDDRSRKLLGYDQDDKLALLQQAISELDQPLQQVFIDTRIVIARANVGRELGIRWSSQLQDQAHNSKHISADYGVQELGLERLQLGMVGAHILLHLELSALEEEGRVITLAQPRVLVQDGHTGSIETGKEIPYLLQEDGKKLRQCKHAVLGLNVMPRILPNQQLLLVLKVAQDSVGELLPNGELALNTHRLNTQVQVGSGTTVVLGGAFYQHQLERLLTNPLFNQVPFLGRLLNNRKRNAERFELLVFVTPKIVNVQS
jgi:type IV pilus assembly protein PilQ